MRLGLWASPTITSVSMNISIPEIKGGVEGGTGNTPLRKCKGLVPIFRPWTNSTVITQEPESSHCGRENGNCPVDDFQLV
ncbi:MAG: hypothetical protein WA775_01160 [Psychroserpens sp.]|uniref:hypothetical protein n=1 Tax=Psychroserpens sp. TaxID=2020870 RepID=UPI003CAFD7EA